MWHSLSTPGMAARRKGPSVTETLRRQARLAEAEALAEAVLQDQNQVLEYQKRQAANRELLAKWRREKSPEKAYMYLGGFFLKLPTAHINSVVQKDQDRLQEWIDVTRSKIKHNMAELQRILPSERPKKVVELLLKNNGK
mmetsp:Transcript_1826/g.4211  ORF Transcript_1826/g.4211 Transcript_1826/m.4211 type:complete len:140 (-) Transcript_1826:297-716(-)